MVLLSIAAAAVLLHLAHGAVPGEEVAAFAGAGCDYSTGQYTYFSMGDGYPSCTVNYFAGTGFPVVGTSYNASFDFPDPGEGCKYLVRAPSNVDNPGCGQVQTQVTKAFCAPLIIPDPFDLNFCCGDDCDAALQGKRDLEWVYVDNPMTVREAKKRDAYAKKIRDMKGSSILRADKMTKRDTTGSWSGSGATQDGPAQQVSSTQNCNTGGSNSATIEVSTSSTQTWEVSASVSAGLFDIVEATLETSYSYAYTEEHSVSTTVTYTCTAGTSGYISWAPTLECSSGSFSSDCSVDGNSCPSGDQTACAPVLNDSGLPLGTANWVEVI